MPPRVIDLDGAVVAQMTQPGVGEAFAGAEFVPARDLASKLRIVASRRALADLAGRLGPFRKGETWFFGSGDFHHLTALFLSRTERPLTVIHFDNHPDWVRWPATMNCGAWVNRALECDSVRRLVTVGPCADDLVRPELKLANLAALTAGRLEVYPWSHAPSAVWRRYGDGPDRKDEATRLGRQLRWRELADEDWQDFWTELTERLPTDEIWITLDKDVLRADEALTNWDQGQLTLDKVETAVRTLGQRRQIIGVDVCGDFSEPAFGDPFRGALAYFDHPPGRPDVHQATAVNASANARLARLFSEVCP